MRTSLTNKFFVYSSLLALNIFLVIPLVSTNNIKAATNKPNPNLSGCVTLQNQNANNPFLDQKYGDLGSISVGYRGFFGREIPLSVDSNIAATQRGIMWWFISIFPVKSVAEAIAHDAAITNPLHKGVYILTDIDFDLNQAPRNSPYELFKSQWGDKKVAREKMFWIFEGEMIPMVKRQVLYFDRPEIEIKDAPQKHPEFGTHFSLEGWTYPIVRGIIRQSDTLTVEELTIRGFPTKWGRNNEYSKLAQRARSLYKKGYRWHVNQTNVDNFKLALEMASNQVRKGQSVEDSRYSEEFKEVFIGSFKRGYAFSVELRNPENNFVAVNIVLRSGNFLSPDTVAYNKDVNLAKVASYALMKMAFDRGIPFIDTQRVSGFSEVMGAHYVPTVVFERDVGIISQMPPLVLPKTWEPIINPTLTLPGSTQQPSSKQN